MALRDDGRKYYLENECNNLLIYGNLMMHLTFPLLPSFSGTDRNRSINLKKHLDLFVIG